MSCKDVNLMSWLMKKSSGRYLCRCRFWNDREFLEQFNCSRKEDLCLCGLCN